MLARNIQTLHIYRTEQRFIFILCGILTVSVFLYIVLVGIVTSTVASHDSVVRGIEAVRSSVSELESQYIALSRGITKEEAFALGFSEPRKEIFAFRKRLVQNGIIAF